MDRYDYKDETCLAEENLFSLNFEEECPGKEIMDAFKPAENFRRYVHIFAGNIGFLEDCTDVDKLITFLLSACEKAKVKISRQTLINWIKSKQDGDADEHKKKESMPASNAIGRENVYKLCFALCLNTQQTGEFFLKAYLERPFNFKNINEAAYYFCMNNALSYDDAVSLAKKAESLPFVENPNAEDVTIAIGEAISKMKTEEQFLNYIADNRSGFTQINKTATRKIESLLECCMAIAPEEYAMNHTHEDKKIKVTNIDELLCVIYGYSARATKKKPDGKQDEREPVYPHSISSDESKFPAMIKRNWPQREQFKNILDKHNASYDVIRRALIMLNFYDYNANAFVHDKMSGDMYDEFRDEMDLILSECGYVQLYPLNPYDWMFLYCMQADNPLEELRKLIDEYYLSLYD